MCDFEGYATFSFPKIINLTPHEVYDVISGYVFPPSGEIARVDVEYATSGELRKFSLQQATYGDVINLPEPDYKNNIFYIVSTMVKAARPDRRDLLSPGPLERENGRIIGCNGFINNNKEEK